MSIVVQEVVIHWLAVIRHQEERMSTLEARIATLEAHRQRNSSNSDRPPAADPPWVKPPHPGKPAVVYVSRAGNSD
jgi:Family of unknown function (DUF6444)